MIINKLINKLMLKELKIMNKLTLITPLKQSALTLTVAKRTNMMITEFFILKDTERIVHFEVVAILYIMGSHITH